MMPVIAGVIGGTSTLTDYTTGMFQWLDFSDASTLRKTGLVPVTTEGDKIIRIYDKASVGQWYSKEGLADFLYHVNAQNGLSVGFNPSANPISIVPNSATSNAQPLSFYIVYKPVNVAVNYVPLFETYAWTGDTGRFGLWNYGGNYYFIIPGLLNCNRAVPESTTHMISTIFNSPDAEFHYNGGADSYTGTIPNTNLGTHSFLNYTWPGGLGLAGGGYVCEIRFYNGYHDAATRGKIEAFLANKWGVAI